MEIRKATLDDLSTILCLFDEGRKKMRQEGNNKQWPEGYPNKETILKDINNGDNYLLIDNNAIIATFALIAGPDPMYSQIYDGAWPNEASYYVIHRITSAAKVHGVLKMVLPFAFSICNTIRIDTHEDNLTMRAALEKYGFTYCGIIHLMNGEPRLAYIRSKIIL